MPQARQRVLIADATLPSCPIVYANAAYERLTGYTLGRARRPPMGRARRAAAGDETLASLKAAIARGKACRAAIPECARTARVTCEISVTPLHGPRGDLRYFLLSHGPLPRFAASARSESAPTRTASLSLLQRELGRARQKIATLDRIDPGTGLLRFPYFQEMLRRDLAMARRDRRFVTLLVFEIVEFAVYGKRSATRLPIRANA